MKTRKLVSGLLAAVCVMAPAFTALADEKPNVDAHRAPAEVVLDGSLDEWNLDSSADMTQKEQLVRDEGQWEDENDLNLNVYFMWDEENLYVALKAIDDTPLMYREGFPPDMADSLVLFIGTDPAADPERTEYAAEDFRVTLIVDEDTGDPEETHMTGIDRDMVADDKGFETVGEDGDEQVLEGYEWGQVETDDGYIFECKIPWSNFSNDEIPVLVPEAGMTISFEVGMFDLDFPCPGVATARMQWCGGSMDVDEDPSLWGTMTFVE